MNTNSSTTRRRTRTARTALALLVATSLVAACGDDDDDPVAAPVDTATDDTTADTTADTAAETTVAATTPETTEAAPETTVAATTPETTEAAPETTAAPAGEGDLATACSTYVDVTLAFNGEPDPAMLVPMLDSLEASAPGDIAAEIGTMVAAARLVIDSGGQDFSAFESVEFSDAQSTVDPYMFENCEFENKLEVAAHDFKFEGLPEELAAGRYAILLTNHDPEVHEIALMRKAEGTTESWEELLELGEEEAGAKVEFVGGGFAPGEGDQGLAVVDFEPGEYLALCFVPFGTTVDDEGNFTEGEGPPHFTSGMQQEFTVT